MMNKDKLVAEMLTAKAEKNNTIDLDAYANGLADMYDNIVNLCKMNWQKNIGAELLIIKKIWHYKFPREQFNIDDFNDWVSENEKEAFYACLEIAGRLLK